VLYRLLMPASTAVLLESSEVLSVPPQQPAVSSSIGAAAGGLHCFATVVVLT
jgi:hypothetical protein